MKKVIYILTTILEVLLLAGAYVIHYFTRRKMGMARYVIYKNHGWEEKYPITALQTITVIALIVLAVFVVLLLLKKRREVKKLVYGMLLVMLVIVIVYVAFTLGSSTETMRDYYFVGGMFALTAFLQELKTLIGVMVCRDEK